MTRPWNWLQLGPRLAKSRRARALVIASRSSLGAKLRPLNLAPAGTLALWVARVDLPGWICPGGSARVDLPGWIWLQRSTKEVARQGAQHGGHPECILALRWEEPRTTLLWSNVPTGAKSFAFAIVDVSAPVAGGFHHWVVYNIPGSVRGLAGHGQDPYSEGTNDFPHVGYDGPCPPLGGEVHDYVFQLYALNVSNIAGQHLSYQALMQEIAKFIIGATVTIGTYVNNAPA
jgi:Raf kinase inhibitor-like YbhB/YbcL family protein